MHDPRRTANRPKREAWITLLANDAPKGVYNLSYADSAEVLIHSLQVKQKTLRIAEGSCPSVYVARASVPKRSPIGFQLFAQ